MDLWGLIIIVVSAILYFASKKKPIFLLTTGIGIGLVIGAVWAAMLVRDAFS
jgi:hypothetical protein